jgi:hypothetical protein
MQKAESRMANAKCQTLRDEWRMRKAKAAEDAGKPEADGQKGRPALPPAGDGIRVACPASSPAYRFVNLLALSLPNRHRVS